mmetsp:Transcript_37349/g.81909  ORF Transcript_37349/g.81909 Transcript_37349/m.81909 type:complete len:146 (+) Transcript_37349:278-715(+)
MCPSDAIPEGGEGGCVNSRHAYRARLSYASTAGDPMSMGAAIGPYDWPPCPKTMDAGNIWTIEPCACAPSGSCIGPPISCMPSGSGMGTTWNGIICRFAPIAKKNGIAEGAVMGADVPSDSPGTNSGASARSEQGALTLATPSIS